MMGTIPFIVGDATKVVVAVAITRRITLKRTYNGKVGEYRS